MTAPSEYLIVFDISEQGFGGWALSLLPLLLTAAGGFGWLVAHRTSEKVAALWIGIVGIGFAGFLLYVSWSQYQRLLGAFNRGEFSVAEGKVTAFQPDQIDDTPQTFAVDGTYFELWGLRPQSGFHQTVGRGGPNLSSMCVRILYTTRPVTGEKEIIWLGVRQCA